MSYIFSWCSSLSSLPDISKWNTINIDDIYGMFEQCSNIKLSTDIKTKFK